MKNNKVLILTGPGGSGKSTIAELLNDKYGYTLIDGDQLDTEFFPDGGQWLPENKLRLANAHDKILTATKKDYLLGKNIVLDYIIFGDYLNFFDKFKKEFGSNLEVRVLLPGEKETILRDKDRQCWTTGVKRIKTVREEFISLKNGIGEENFIDTSDQTPQETAENIFETTTNSANQIMKKVESAGGVIINEFSEVVVVFTDTKSWQLPKGTVEKDESYFDTATRKIKEETGLKNLNYVKELPAYSRISTHEDNTIRYIHYLLFRTKKQNLTASAEVTECKWVPIEEIEHELTHPEDKQFVKNIVKEI
ncbi:MAG: NUDIX domain-containing protein [Candidatus Saccharibacteria bacterium]